MTNDRNFFFFFINDDFVNDIDFNFQIKKHDVMRLFCKKNKTFTINNVLYVKNCRFNFLFYNHLKIDDCFIKIFDDNHDDFELNNNDVKILLHRDFYFLKQKEFVICMIVNFDIFRM